LQQRLQCTNAIASSNCCWLLPAAAIALLLLLSL
jgi:hypothetical protein